jgi:hypothetical protein
MKRVLLTTASLAIALGVGAAGALAENPAAARHCHIRCTGRSAAGGRCGATGPRGLSEPVGLFLWPPRVLRSLGGGAHRRHQLIDG